VLREEVAAALGRARFLREIEIVAQLRHPNIVPLYDSGEAGELLYYVMPYEAGHSLRHRLVHGGAVPVDHVLVILRDVCDALAYAHSQGVIHRDIKPDNVLISGRHALVSDFGIARALTAATGPLTLTSDGVLLGTPQYMAPEQVAGDANVDHRADIYAVGVLAYELLTGRPPFVGDSPQAILTGHLVQTPTPRSLTVRTCLPIWRRRDEVSREAAGRPAADRRRAAWPSRSDDCRDPQRAFDTPGASRSARRVWRSGRVRHGVARGDRRGADEGRAAVARRGRTSQLTSSEGWCSRDLLMEACGLRGRQLAANEDFVKPVAGGRTPALTNDTTENE
jgi:serine/threonine protein kinase